MTKQELKELLVDEYPISEGLEARLFKRLSIFPDAVSVYARNPERICYRSNEWFLVEQLDPSLVTNPYAKPSVSTHIENIIQGCKAQDIDWISVYEFVLDDYIPVLSSRQLAIFHDLLDVYRDEPHDEFDII